MPDPSVTGLNHVTLACHELARSIAFYRDILGCTLRADWPDGAYLEVGTFWLCLARQAAPVSPRDDYTHMAFGCATADFDRLSQRIKAGAGLWQDNKSEGASLYFLDPDGHRLELHSGDLQSRLSHYRASNCADIKFHD